MFILLYLFYALQFGVSSVTGWKSAMTGLQLPLLPFPLSKALLNYCLRTFDQQPLTRSSLSSSHKDLDNSIDYIPGEPIVDLTGASVWDFLAEELNTLVLD
jgi:hypothetical protein